MAIEELIPDGSGHQAMAPAVAREAPPPLRRQVLDLVEAGRPVTEVAELFGVADHEIYRWRNRDLIDRGTRTVARATDEAGASARHRIRELEAALVEARRRIHALELELATLATPEHP